MPLGLRRLWRGVMWHNALLERLLRPWKTAQLKQFLWLTGEEIMKWNHFFGGGVHKLRSFPRLLPFTHPKNLSVFWPLACTDLNCFQKSFLPFQKSVIRVIRVPFGTIFAAFVYVFTHKYPMSPSSRLKTAMLPEKKGYTIWYPTTCVLPRTPYGHQVNCTNMSSRKNHVPAPSLSLPGHDFEVSISATISETCWS